MSESGQRGGRRLSRRDFLLLGGAGVMGAGGAALLGAKGYEGYLKVTGAGAQEPPTSLGGSVSRTLGLSGGDGMNVILVVIDSLRKDHVGAYGLSASRNGKMTPNMDALAAGSLRFERAVPEAMPTIPARRSIHTGMRSFPFRDWYPPKGDNVRLYGWEPVPESQWTLAEILGGAGYYTAMISDNCHQAKASYNFQRGFEAFEILRGQEKDLYRPMWLCPEEKINNTLMVGDRAAVEGKMRQYFANTTYRKSEEDYFAPQVFATATSWLDGLAALDRPFFLTIDSFDPHEPWDPPDEYVKLYGDGYEDYPEPEPFAPIYGSTDYLEESQLERMKTLYAAELTMVDRWFGRFMDKVESLGMLEDTAVILVSDHGVAFGEHGVVGKPHSALWPEVTDVPFLIHHPEGKLAGESHDYRASTHDIVPTILGLTGVEVSYEMDGEDLTPLFDGESLSARDHFTAGLHDQIVCRDDDYAMISSSQGRGAKLYDLRKDPDQHNDIASDNPDVVERMYREYVLKDAGGELPTYGLKV